MVRSDSTTEGRTETEGAVYYNDVIGYIMNTINKLMNTIKAYLLLDVQTRIQRRVSEFNTDSFCRLVRLFQDRLVVRAVLVSNSEVHEDGRL